MRSLRFIDGFFGLGEVGYVLSFLNASIMSLASSGKFRNQESLESEDVDAGHYRLSD